MDGLTRRRLVALAAVLALVGLLVAAGVPAAAHEGESHTTTTAVADSGGGFDVGRVALSLGVGVGTAALAGVGLLLWRRLS